MFLFLRKLDLIYYLNYFKCKFNQKLLILIELSDNINSYINELFGKEISSKYVDFFHSSPDAYFRLAFDKQEKIMNSFEAYGIACEKLPFFNNVYITRKNKELLGKTLEHSLGQIYIQSLSSMAPPYVLNPSQTDSVLDLCAAPGSKFTQISKMMNYDGTLVGCEPNINRIKMLAFNIDRMGSVNAGAALHRGEDLSGYFPDFFDKILVDAPCSALGVIHKRGEVSSWWNINRLENLASMQYKLLVSAIKSAKPGGELVYSTCTMTIEENEMVINKVLNKYPVELVEFSLPFKTFPAFSAYKNINFHKSIEFTKRIMPWDISSEGFFIAKLIKTGETEVNKARSVFNTKEIIDYNNLKIKDQLRRLADHFGISDDLFKNYKYLIKNNDIYFINANWRGNRPIKYVRIGIPFGSFNKDKNIILKSEAAYIVAKNARSNIFHIESETELKNYLSGRTIKFNEHIKDQAIVIYNDYILGTATASVNGLKSQYPKSKRANEIIKF